MHVFDPVLIKQTNLLIFFFSFNIYFLLIINQLVGNNMIYLS